MSSPVSESPYSWKSSAPLPAMTTASRGCAVPMAHRMALKRSSITNRRNWIVTEQRSQMSQSEMTVWTS